MFWWTGGVLAQGFTSYFTPNINFPQVKRLVPRPHVRNWASRAGTPQLAGLIPRASSITTVLFIPPPLAFHLFSSPTCSGNTADFYLYAPMLWRYGVLGHLSSFPRPASLAPSLYPTPSSFAGIFASRSQSYFYMLQLILRLALLAP